MCGYRRLRDSFNKTKFTVLAAVLGTAIICLHLQHETRGFIIDSDSLVSHKNQNRIVDERETKPTVRTSYLYNAVKHYDVFINGYMRSGSTLTGMILGWRDDSFYVNEPLWKISRWTYWHGNDTVCRTDIVDCRKIDPGKAVLDKSFTNIRKNYAPPGSLVMAKKILRQIYDCQFDYFERTAYNLYEHVSSGGPSWRQMINCVLNTGQDRVCLRKIIPKQCKKTKHRVTKVLRLSTDLLADILNARENLKVIHLFRDPRAIINSRIQTEWYPVDEEQHIMKSVRSLCNKMLYDFREGQKLQKRFPDRFKFIYYEDLNEKPFDKSKELYKYLGMDLDESKYPKVMNLSVFSKATNQTEREKNTAFWWRTSLKWNIVQIIDSVCKDVYTELGYKSLANAEEYRNLSISSVEIPKEYWLGTSFRTRPVSGQAK